MNADDLELIKEFVVESIELLDEAEPKLIGLQMAGDKLGSIDKELVNSIFRLFHSMKGTAGMLPLKNISRLTHTAETLLDLFRKGIAVFKPIHTDALLRCMDFIRGMLEQVDRESHDQGFEEAVNVQIEELNDLIQQSKGGITAEKSASNPSLAQLQTATPVMAAVAAEISLELADMEVPITPDMQERFTQEAEEILEQFEQAWLKMEAIPDEETLQVAFRAIHSFKGNCSFMGLSDLAKISHTMETVMEALKEKHLAFNPDISALLLRETDVLREHVAGLGQNPKGAVADLDQHVEQLEKIIACIKPAAAECVMPAGVLEENKNSPEDSNQPNIHQVVSRAIARQDIRVDLNKLDKLVNLVGELVTAETMMTRHPAILAMRDESVEKAIHQLRLVSQELQDVAMAVRMVPLSTTFQKMIRLVHDLSKKSGKQVELLMTGEDTEVDKTVIEKIADPLVHIVRNAIDHGLELPEERKAQGKPATGKLTIDARHEGGEVWITISDDGKGLDRDRILMKAIEKGLVAEHAELSDKQINKLIFEPGFSTADKVTDISGRGVGMDVVKKNIEKLKGRIEINTQKGKGSVFILRIPLTLAIIEGMLVRLGSARYTIPMLAIRESFRPQAKQITTMPDGSEVVKVRNEIIPIIRLHKIFNKPSDITELTRAILVIVEVEGQPICLMVDEILGQQETVIKGVSDYLGKARGVSGCTILGDGEVSLILDINEILMLADSQCEQTVCRSAN